MHDIQERQQARHGNHQRVGVSQEYRAAQAETRPEEITHTGSVRAKLGEGHDTEAAVAIKRTEGASIKGTAFCRLQHHSHVLVGRENANGFVNPVVTSDIFITALRVIGGSALQEFDPVRVQRRGECQRAGEQVSQQIASDLAGSCQQFLCLNLAQLAPLAPAVRRLPFGDDFPVQPAPVGDVRAHSGP